ncbi:hypothetical protein VTH06DRAFT_7337 [Thermothelomyces fergusii]
MELFSLLSGGPGPAISVGDTAPNAPMVNGVNGVGGVGDGGSSSVSDAVATVQMRELKRRRVDVSNDGVEAHQATEQDSLPGRSCFVTVGATAGFRALLDEVSTVGFLQCLAEHGYATLVVQCGPDQAVFDNRVAGLSDADKHGVTIHSFGYTRDMQAHILNCRGQAGVRPAGCVISHGGTGTVGEVLGIGAPLIVVANPTLMDNHQLELAESLEEQNIAVHGRIGFLAAAIDRIAERIAQDELAAQMHIANLHQAEEDFANRQSELLLQQLLQNSTANQENNGLLQLD